MNNNPNEYMRNQIDPDMLDDLADPTRAIRGFALGIIFSIPFWGILIALVWMVDRLIGG